MSKQRKISELFSMSFLDIMACGFGALVLILLISEFQESEVKQVENNADIFLEAQEERAKKIIKVESLDKLMSSNIEDLISTRQRLDVLKMELEKKSLISAKLNDLASDTDFQISKQRLNSLSAPMEQKEASGIKLDSRYLVFIIDTSGSMEPWVKIVQEIDNLIQTFPDLEGYMVMNDNGSIFHGGDPWLNPTKINRSASIGILRANRAKYGSLSNPIVGLKKVIRVWGDKYKDLGVFIMGDDILDQTSRIETISQEVLKLNTDLSGKTKVRVNAVGFLTSRANISQQQGNKNYLMLMRELTEQSGGAMVVVN
ncbi:hypothetical protein N9H52_01825 [Gammaproteobacteria bacterium]|jgi:hypothetical protein|nr:hypothetical protein [Gammaproteobacteria bacterium]